MAARLAGSVGCDGLSLCDAILDRSVQFVASVLMFRKLEI